MIPKTSCWPEEIALSTLVVTPEDLERVLSDIRKEEQTVYDDWRTLDRVEWYCRGCPRIPECYNKSGFKIRGLRNYQQ